MEPPNVEFQGGVSIVFEFSLKILSLVIDDCFNLGLYVIVYFTNVAR